MNDDTQVDQSEQFEAGAAGAPEGTPPTAPEADEVAKMYDELGIKAPAPTGKSKGRPKSTKVRAKDVSEKDAGDTKTRQQGDDDSAGKSKDAPDSGKDGDSGDDSDSKGKKVSKDSGEVSDKSKKADGGVHTDESESEDDSQRGSEKDAGDGDSGAGQEAHQSDDSSEEGKTDEGKRPGKSNPEIERRFQKMTTEIREREQRIDELERQLRETVQQSQQRQIEQEDPEYTVEDFAKVKDENGNVIDLDPEQAELAWRRWQDGFNQRKAERESEAAFQETLEREQHEYTQQMMQQSADAYDTLTSILEEYPELNTQSGSFDQELSDSIMPIIHDSIIYQPGTEPGNEEGLQPVIAGMRMDPRGFLRVVNNIRAQKRSLPLNGTDDNVDIRSNVNVPHSRSSDPTARAANELYKELGIDKRV